MDRFQQIYYEKDFQLSFLKAKGDTFQQFFEKLMGKVYPYDFKACRPWGNVGDKKNDGYLQSKRILFQVYAPNEMSAKQAISKINEDFEGAKEHWKKYFDEWIFVHNTHDGRLSPQIIERLEELRQENPQIKIGHWGYEELLIEFQKLNITSLESWFGVVFDITTYANLGYDQLQAVLQYIQVETPSDSNDVREVSQGKIEANMLSPVVADFLKIGMQKFRLVEGFFNNWRDPNYETQLANAFKNKYIEIRDQSPATLPGMIFAELEEWAGGNVTRTPTEKAAVLAILAYFFDKCVIFEDSKAIS
jgi:C-terminal domain 10 of the ABC-three component (ABC-3C) systems